MWLIGVEVEQDTSAPPPKKNPGSAPDTYSQYRKNLDLLEQQSATQPFQWGGALRDDSKSGCVADYLNRGREESVGNDDVSIICAGKQEMARMT